MRSPLALLLTAFLFVGCGEKAPPPVVSAPTQAQPTHTPDNDYGNPNLKAGNPSKAATDIANVDNYLLVKPQYVLSYSKNRNLANWAAWELNKSWMGDAKRQNDFRPDASLPKGWYQVVTTSARQ